MSGPSEPEAKPSLRVSLHVQYLLAFVRYFLFFFLGETDERPLTLLWCGVLLGVVFVLCRRSGNGPRDLARAADERGEDAGCGTGLLPTIPSLLNPGQPAFARPGLLLFLVSSPMSLASASAGCYFVVFFRVFREFLIFCV